MQRRYALMPWLCWSVAFVAGVERMRRRELRIAMLSAVPLLMLVANRQEWGYEFGRTQRMSDEARFFYGMPPDSFLRSPTVPPAAMGELNWLKTAHAGKPGGAAWFYDDYFLCTPAFAPKRAWEYEPSKRSIVEITSTLPSIAQRYCSSIRNDKPHNEAEYGALSTMTAILGRMATYSGQIVKWDAAFTSNHSLTSDAEKWDGTAPVAPDTDGRYAIAVPGVTKVV